MLDTQIWGENICLPQDKIIKLQQTSFHTLNQSMKELQHPSECHTISFHTLFFFLQGVAPSHASLKLPSP